MELDQAPESGLKGYDAEDFVNELRSMWRCCMWRRTSAAGRRRPTGARHGMKATGSASTSQKIEEGFG
jgi:hypothetical protein